MALTFIDQARARPVPVLVYGRGAWRPLAILSHGYGAHAGDYGFIATDLVRRGYLVVSIEHLERPGDPPMANGGDLTVRRRPVWRIGADSISFVIAELHRRRLATASGGVVLIGHSNGGDMTMMFAANHPAEVRVALSLDNRRMPLPRTPTPHICSMRSSDLPADPGVLPSPDEQTALAMTIAAVPVRHEAMNDRATVEEKRAMLAAMARCLETAHAG